MNSDEVKPKETPDRMAAQSINTKQSSTSHSTAEHTSVRHFNMIKF